RVARLRRPPGGGLRRRAAPLADRLLPRPGGAGPAVADRPDRQRPRAGGAPGAGARGVPGRDVAPPPRPAHPGDVPPLRAARRLGARRGSASRQPAPADPERQARPPLPVARMRIDGPGAARPANDDVVAVVLDDRPGGAVLRDGETEVVGADAAPDLRRGPRRDPPAPSVPAFDERNRLRRLDGGAEALFRDCEVLAHSERPRVA